jgi:hypothetical protein
LASGQATNQAASETSTPCRATQQPAQSNPSPHERSPESAKPRELWHQKQEKHGNSAADQSGHKKPQSDLNHLIRRLGTSKQRSYPHHCRQGSDVYPAISQAT